jgi:peroxiredoxin
MARQLNFGDSFPEYQAQTAAGHTLRLPQDLTGEYAALIFYRGSW